MADHCTPQTQCRIFSLNYNPDRLRLGNKVLRQRLRGPTLASWYPKQTVSFRQLQNSYKQFGLTTFDEAEDDREEAIQVYVYFSHPAGGSTEHHAQCQDERKGSTQEEANRRR